MEDVVREKNGLKLLKFPKPKVELTDGQREEADKFVAPHLLREVLEKDGPEIEKLLILYQTKDGALHWVGNQGDNAHQAWFMDEVKFAMIEEEILGDEEEPEPKKPA